MLFQQLVTGSGGARPQNLGGHLRGKLIFWGGKIEFLKRSPPPGDSPIPLKRGANILGISPPFRIFAPHICDVVYSNNFVILSSY
jgi:hypothetical protein